MKLYDEDDEIILFYIYRINYILIENHHKKYIGVLQRTLYTLYRYILVKFSVFLIIRKGTHIRFIDTNTYFCF